jgi:hypothetical protein
MYLDVPVCVRGQRLRRPFQGPRLRTFDVHVNESGTPKRAVSSSIAVAGTTCVLAPPAIQLPVSVRRGHVYGICFNRHHRAIVSDSRRQHQCNHTLMRPEIEHLGPGWSVLSVRSLSPVDTGQSRSYQPPPVGSSIEILSTHRQYL